MSPTSPDQTTRILGPSGQSVDPASLDRQALPLGSRIGDYIVIAELGEGGMGRVYLADQIEPVRRQVALKIGRAPADGFDASGFLAEHQVLARMNHPGIAQVFDAGTLEDGRPWMVMEYIRGVPIVEFCEARSLDPGARIRLLVEVCRGIEHAHQRMLLHLDLKPSNLLVAEIDGRPVPRVIDFGAARIRGAGHEPGCDQRSTEWVSGTLAYMAPEQLDFGAMPDSRADVFSLGAILYELLSARRFREFPPDAGDELSSLRTRMLEAAPVCLAETPAGRLGARRRVELEAILARATAPERDRRYGSAAELAAELERWLQRRPVAAMPDRSGYRLRCLLARQAVPMALAALTLAALLTGLVGTGLGLQEAREQRRVAEQRQADLEHLVQFQQRMLGQVDIHQLAELMVSRMAESARNLALRAGEPETAADGAAGEARAMIERLAPMDAARDLLVDGVLEQADALIGREYSRGDRIEAALRLSLGETLIEWQSFDRAGIQIDRAREIYRTSGAPDDPEALRAEVEAVKLHWWRQEYREAQQLATAVRPRAEAALGTDHDLSLYLLRAEAVMAGNLGEHARGIELFERLLPRLIARYGPDHPETLQIEGDLLFSLRRQIDDRCPAELLERYRLHLQRTAKLEGPAARTHAISSMNFAGCAVLDGDLEEAILHYRAAVDTAREVLGERHTITLIALNDLAHSLLIMGRVAEAEALLDSLEANQRLVYGEDSHMLFYPRSYRLQIAVLRGEAAAALPGIKALIAEAEAHPLTTADFVGWLWRIRSGAEIGLQRFDDARNSAERALALCRQAASGNARACLAERASLARTGLLGGRPPSSRMLEELARDAASLRLHDPIRNMVAWMRYSLDPPGESRERLRRDELVWLLDASSEALHPIQREIRDDLVQLEAGVNARP